jgi:translation initiation factor IF-2
MKKTESKKSNIVERPPVVVVMGHIDHGKSTLLDYIRKTKIVDKEAGGITQHVSAYEITYSAGGSSKTGKGRRVTFLDTPGHEAFQTLRSRGAKVADVAILVVSVEDGVKPQTKEALERIKEQNIPFVVAINKIDKPNANIERTKLSLAENEIYVEGYGGTVSAVPISAKTGEGIPELIDVVFLAADLQELKGDLSANASGIAIESTLDPRKGISASLIIKDGTLEVGQYIVAGGSLATVRSIISDTGERLTTANFSTPITIIGWSELVQAGADFVTFDNKNEAIAFAGNFKNTKDSSAAEKISADRASGIVGINSVDDGVTYLPIVIKADTLGSLEAISYEIAKLGNERIQPKIISQGVGAIGEGDIKTATVGKKAVVFGFNTKADSAAGVLSERDGIQVETFSVIYKLTERVDELLKEQTPKMMVDEITGRAKVLRTFSKQRDKQIIGGRVEEGFISVGKTVRIIRREAEIGLGKIKGMQQQKKDTDEVKAGNEFGAFVESKFEIAAGDILMAFHTIEK